VNNISSSPPLLLVMTNHQSAIGIWQSEMT
jgi:hypothetical protein